MSVLCDYRLSEKCRHEWTVEERLANETRARNNGRIICIFCSRTLKSTGRRNPNCAYRSLDDRFFEVVDSEAKAYLLGWIASDGSITKASIAIYIHRRDEATLRTIRDAICEDLPIRPKARQPLVGFTINSVRIVADVCRHLDIVPGKKDSVVGFPTLATTALGWAFMRGLFDGDGSISSIAAALNRKEWPAPRCSLASTSSRLLDAVAAFCGVPAYRGKAHLEWNGANALDLLGRLYGVGTLRLARKYDSYLDWCSWVPSLVVGIDRRGSHPLFRWARTRGDAVAPAKAAVSDSGFDLTLIERGRRVGAIEFFHTGIKIQPAFGWYFDVVPRSSISKTGYMLANSIGVIDRGYVGEIMVPLVKVDPTAQDLELPSRVVQLVPRPIIAAQLIEVDDLDETVRGSGGFGSTG